MYIQFFHIGLISKIGDYNSLRPFRQSDGKETVCICNRTNGCILFKENIGSDQGLTGLIVLDISIDGILFLGIGFHEEEAPESG